MSVSVNKEEWRGERGEESGGWQGRGQHVYSSSEVTQADAWSSQQVQFESIPHVSATAVVEPRYQDTDWNWSVT